MPSSILTLGSDVFFLQDRNARHYFPGLYQEHCLVQERERSDSSVLIIDSQEDKATSSILPANIRKLSNATDASDARDAVDARVAEDAVAGTARKRRKTQRALEADVGSMRNTRRKTAANANKENLPQRTDRSGRVAPTEAAGQRGQGTKGTKGTEGTKGTKGTAGRKPPRAPSKNRQPISYADLRADARMLAIPGTTASSRRTHAELTQAIVNHIPDMTVAQLIQVCHKKRLSLETLPRAPRKKDYVTLLVHHYS